MKLAVGTVVTLNNRGIKSIGGLDSWAMVNQARCMKITKVEDIGIFAPGLPPVLAIQVDATMIDRFMLTSRDVDLA